MGDDRGRGPHGTGADDLSSYLEWPRGVARLGVALCVALAIAYGLVYAVRAIDRLGDDASRNASLNFDDREFGGGNYFVVDKNALYEARALFPEDEAYRVVPGPGVEGASPFTELYIETFARYFLMPRRTSPDADWILCYGCDVASLGDGFQTLWQDDAGIVLGRMTT